MSRGGWNPPAGHHTELATVADVMARELLRRILDGLRRLHSRLLDIEQGLAAPQPNYKGLYQVDGNLQSNEGVSLQDNGVVGNPGFKTWLVNVTADDGLRGGMVLADDEVRVAMDAYIAPGLRLHADSDLPTVESYVGAPSSGEDLLAIRVRGDTTLGGVTGLDAVRVVATENWGNTAQGFKTEVYANPDGGTSNTLALTADDLGVDISGRSIADALMMRERSTDPDDPAEGQSVIWQSDGSDTGSDGDILVKVTAGGLTKTAILFPFGDAP